MQCFKLCSCRTVLQHLKSSWQWLSEIKHDSRRQALRGLLVMLIAFRDSNEESWCKVIFLSGILSAHTPHPVIKKPIALLHLKCWSCRLVSSWHMIIWLMFRLGLFVALLKKNKVSEIWRCDNCIQALTCLQYGWGPLLSQAPSKWQFRINLNSCCKVHLLLKH